MAKWNKGLIFAMEELEENEAPEVEGGADSLETSMLETNEAGADLDDMDSSIEEAVEGAEEIEAIADTMEDTIEEGGADAATARVAEVAVESVYKRLNINRRAIPSLESFGTRSSRAQATRYAVEGFKEQAQAIWKRIWEAIQKAWAWIKGWYEKLFDANVKLEARAKKLKEAAGKLSGSPKEGQMDAGGIGVALALGGSFSASNVVKGLKETGLVVKKNNTNIAKATEVLGGVSLKSDVTTIAASISGKITDLAGSKLPGNKEVKLEKTRFFDKMKPVISESGKSDAKIEKIDVASTSDMSAIADAVLSISEGVKGSKEMSSKLDKSYGKLKDLIQSGLKETTKESEDKEASKQLMQAIPELNSGLIAMAKTVNSYAMGVAKTGLDYVEKSMKQYEAAK